MILRLNPYLTLDGRVKEAVAYYERVLGAKVIGMQTFGEMPPNPDFPLPESAKDRVAHALLKVGETDLMLSDTFPGQPVATGDQVTICLTTNDPATSKNVFDALADGGQVVMPLQETFWAAAYGIVRDKFGITFQITTESPENK